MNLVSLFGKLVSMLYSLLRDSESILPKSLPPFLRLATWASSIKANIFVLVSLVSCKVVVWVGVLWFVMVVDSFCVACSTILAYVSVV